MILDLDKCQLNTSLILGLGGKLYCLLSCITWRNCVNFLGINGIAKEKEVSDGLREGG